MRLKQITIFALVLTLLFPNALFAANPKSGAKCSKAGQTQVYSGKKFTCIKSGKNLVWNNGVELPKPKATQSPSVLPTSKPQVIDWSKNISTDEGYLHLFSKPCEKESNIAPQWFDLQESYFKYSNCIWPISVGKYYLGQLKPKSDLSISALSPIETCAISEPSNSNSHRGRLSNSDAWRREFYNNKKIPGPVMNIQIVPIFADDTASPKNSPEEDYKKFTDFISDWVIQSSDMGSTVKVNFPKNYIKVRGKIGDYGITHEGHELSDLHVKFNKEILSQVDSVIDFTGANLAIFVVPAGTSFSVLSQGAIGALQTNEGIVTSASSQFPYTLEGYGSVRFKHLSLPYWWLHELYHVGFSLQHHDGDGLEDINTDFGMGAWSLMSHGGGDLLAWDKWLVGFIGDSQVNCVKPNTISVTWLAPSSVKTTNKKLTVIPISEFKVIAIESIRASGLYYKLPKTSEGVLVYEVDLTQTKPEMGLKLALPKNRDPNKGPYFLAEAALRMGESVELNGHKITVVESGTFGDVVKVEKA
jgi:hypothetical protein